MEYSTPPYSRYGQHFMLVCYSCGGRPATYQYLANYPRTTCISGQHAMGQVSCCKQHDEVGDCPYCRMEDQYAAAGRPDVVWGRIDPANKAEG